MSDIKNDEYNSTLPDQQKLVFDNVYGELEFYKKKCEVMEKDLFKSQTQVKKLEISLKKLQELNAMNGKNNNNTSISFLLPSEFKTFWENFAKNLVLEAFDCLYDDYTFLAYVTYDTLQIAYQQTKEFMKVKVNQVLNVLNISIGTSTKTAANELEKFFSRFKVIFQDYFSSIFIFTEEYNNSIKSKLLAQVREYSFISPDQHSDKLEDLQSDLDKKSFKNLTQSLFKMCIFMILHDPVLTFNIKNHTEREITYLFYNKNEMMNIEGFGTEQTPCAVIVPPPILRKNFAYMGIKPGVYCIQKSEINDKILAECEKNKLLHPRNASGDLSATINNINNNIASPKKLNANKSASYGDVQSLNTATPVKGENIASNYHSNTEKKKENQIPFMTKTKRNNSEDFKEELKILSTNSNAILTQEQDKFGNGKEEKKKKCYDHPLIMKNKKIEESVNTNFEDNKPSFVGSFINNPNMKISSPMVCKPTYKSNTMNYKTKNNSRSSSIGESHENSIDSKNLVNHLHLHNLNNLNANMTNLQNYTKTSRVFMNKNPLDTEGNNTNTIPIRYIPTGTSIPTESNGFNMIRSKNTKQVYISDKKRETTNESLEEKIYDANRINYPLKENKDYLRSKNDSEHYKKIDLKYREENISQYFNTKNFTHSNYGKSTGIKVDNMDSKRKINASKNNYTGALVDSSSNYANLNRKLNAQSEGYSRSNNTSNIVRATSKEIIADSRVFASTPTDLLEINSEKAKNESFLNYMDTGNNVRTNSGDTNAINDMKFNGPKKDNFAIRISKMKDKDLDLTPNGNNKVKAKVDIKSQIGKYYNKVVNSGNTGHSHSNSGGGNISNSPSSLYTYSVTNTSEKNTLSQKVGNNNNRSTNSYFNNFQQKFIKK